MTNSTGIPSYHLLNTIRVYKGYYKEHGVGISYNVVEFLFLAFHIKKEKVYIALICAKCCIERYWIPMPQKEILSFSNTQIHEVFSEIWQNWLICNLYGFGKKRLVD
jgi:hypothetical protein